LTGRPLVSLFVVFVKGIFELPVGPSTIDTPGLRKEIPERKNHVDCSAAMATKSHHFQIKAFSIFRVGSRNSG